MMLVVSPRDATVQSFTSFELQCSYVVSAVTAEVCTDSHHDDKKALPAAGWPFPTFLRHPVASCVCTKFFTDAP